jgi:hypothetical protein
MDELVEKFAEQLYENRSVIKGQWSVEQGHTREAYRVAAREFLKAVEDLGYRLGPVGEPDFDVEKFKEASSKKRRSRKGKDENSGD